MALPLWTDPSAEIRLQSELVGVRKRRPLEPFGQSVHADRGHGRRGRQRFMRGFE